MSDSAQTTTEDSVPDEHDTSYRPESFLFAVMHCDNPMLGGARYKLSGVDEVEFFRGAERAALRVQIDGLHKLQITLPGRTVSRSHGRLVRRGDSWLLEDTGSRNGVFVNGMRVTSAPVADGDDLFIGDVIFRYRARLLAPLDVQVDLDSEAQAEQVPGLFTLVPAHEVKLAALQRIARLATPILLVGDVGTGKEALAKSIHVLSGRSGPFISVKCGIMGSTMVESQLFGNAKDAFTGAARDERGYFRRADGGTLFLDEIGALPQSVQSALLRVLEESEVVPVGAAEAVKVNVRVVAGMQPPIESLVARGEFREDLWAALNGYRHELPSLVERIDDLGVLMRDILRRPSVRNAQSIRFGTQAARAMLYHSWSYNVHELTLALDIATRLAGGTVITKSNLPIEHAPLPPPFVR